MSKNIIKIFDDLECYETRFDGTYVFNREKQCRVYSGSGTIFKDKITYNVSFTRKRLGNSQYSEKLTDINGELTYKNKKYKLTNAIIDRGEDEFLFTFENEKSIIQLDCKKVDFRFHCDFLSH